MVLRALIDHITDGFGDSVDVTQKDVLDEDIRKQFPQYAQLPDEVLAQAAATHSPDQYGYLAKFSPEAKVEPAKIPQSMRTEQFYQKNPDIATSDAKATLAQIRTSMPAYADVPDPELAAAAEQNQPEKFRGLTAKLNAGEIEKARADARERVLSVANDVAKQLKTTIGTTVGSIPVQKFREGFNAAIAPHIDKIKQDTVNYWAPSEEDIVKHTQETGQIPYSQVLKRTAITTAVSQIPSTIEDFSLFLTAPELGRTAGALAGKALPGVAEALTKTRMGPIDALRAKFPDLADAVKNALHIQGSANNPIVERLGGENVTRGTNPVPKPTETTTTQPEPGQPALNPAPGPTTPPPVEKSAVRLNPEQSAIEADAIKTLQDNYPTMAAEYRKKFGKTLNVDDARKLFPAYEATHEARLSNAAAVHEPASALTKGLYEQMIHEPDPTGNNTVLFMAGGGGSGKTSSLRYNDAMKPLLDEAQVVVDGTLANSKNAAGRIDSALSANKNVQIVTVYRPPEEAFTHALDRAQRTGRPVPIDAFIYAHQGYPETIKALAQKYQGDSRVQFHFIDNSNGAGRAHVSTIDVLSKAGYTEKASLRRIADDAYQAGKIDERVYRSAIGEEPPVRRTTGASSGAEPQPVGPSGPAAPENTPSKVGYEQAGNALEVPVSDLHTSPERFQPRAGLIDSRVKTLAEGMQDKGFNPAKPVIAWQDPKDGKLYVLAGHHRLAAAERAGLEKIPTVIQSGSEAAAIALARRSNSTRAPMNPVEEAKAYKAESDSGATFADISKNYGGVRASEIQRKLNLNNLSPGLQGLVDEGQFPVAHAIELGRSAAEYGLSETVQQQIFNEVVKKMDVTPGTFKTMLDTLGPAAAKQIDMGFDFKIDQGILAPLRELATKTKTLEKARRQLSGYMKYVDDAAARGEKLTTAQSAVRSQAQKSVAGLEKEITQLRRSVGKAAQPAALPKAATQEPDMQRLFPEPASAETGSVSLGPDKPAIDLGNGTIATFKRELYDRFEPIKYKTGSEISPQHPSAGGLYTESYVGARELKGKIRARGEELLKELNDIVQPLENNGDRQVLNKIYSLRNFAELDQLGKTTSGVTADMAAKAMEDLKTEIGTERFNRISLVADKVADLQNNKALDILVEGKIIKPETAAKLRERYPHYLRSEILDAQLASDHPEFRSSDNGEPIGRINKSFLKTKEGTKKLINTDVLDVVRRSLVTKVASAEKQKVVDKIADQFGTEIGIKIYKDGALVTRVDPKKIPPGYVKSNIPVSGNKIYAVRQDVENLLQGLNKHQMDMVTNTMGAFNRFFKTGATTYRAPFVLSNLFRDAQELLFKGRSVPGQTNRAVAYARALISSVKEATGIPDATFEAWQRGGGSYGGVVTSVPKGVPLPFKLLEPRQKITEVVKRGLMLPFKAVSIPAEILENTSRLAEYNRLKGTSLPESLKVLNSRDITVDFEKMGDAMKLYNTHIPFLNPGVQGAVNIGRAIKEQPLVSVAKFAAYIAVPTVALYAWNRKFSNDDTIDPYIKDNFWYINTGAETIKDGKKVPIILTVRKGETAQFFSYPIQNMLEFASHDKNFTNHLDDWNPAGMARGFASWLTPPLVKEPLEQAANYDFFRQGPIVSRRLEDVKPGYQFTRGTTNSARKLGEGLNASPVRLEHAAYGIWPASRQVLQLMDAVFNPQPTFPMKPKDALERSRDFQPIVRTPSGFFSQDEQAAQRFKQQYNEGKRTPAFLFKEAMTRYAESKAPADLETAKTFARSIPPKQRQQIIRSIRADIASLNFPASSRPFARMGKAERRAYSRQLQEANK